LSEWKQDILQKLLILNLPPPAAQKASIVANEEVIAVDQDPLSQAGDRIYVTPKNGQVWKKQLADGEGKVFITS